jgi:ribonuclease HI
VVSDSQYLVRGMTQWLEGWIRQGKLETEGGLANQDLWIRLAALSRQQSVTWEWVRGHNGHPFNSRADELARAALKLGREAGAIKAHAHSSLEAQAVDSPQSQPPTMAIPTAKMDTAPFECEEDGQFRFH